MGRATTKGIAALLDWTSVLVGFFYQFVYILVKYQRRNFVIQKTYLLSNVINFHLFTSPTSRPHETMRYVILDVTRNKKSRVIETIFVYVLYV